MDLLFVDDDVDSVDDNDLAVLLLFVVESKFSVLVELLFNVRVFIGNWKIT